MRTCVARPAWRRYECWDRKLFPNQRLPYGLTVRVALVLLVMPPEVALIVTVPCACAVARPPATVATCVLLEFQLALEVMSNTPLHVVAFAVNCQLLGVPVTEIVALVGSIAID